MKKLLLLLSIAFVITANAQEEKSDKVNVMPLMEQGAKLFNLNLEPNLAKQNERVSFDAPSKIEAVKLINQSTGEENSIEFEKVSEKRYFFNSTDLDGIYNVIVFLDSGVKLSDELKVVVEE